MFGFKDLIMKSSIVFLPALVAICHGAAIPQPQELGSIGVTFSPEPTGAPAFTFVLPCVAATGKSCSPRTLTLYGRDAEAMPRSLLAREPMPQILWTGEVSRTNIIIPPNPTRSQHTSKSSSTSDCDSTTVDQWKREPQILWTGEVSRTNIILPPNPTKSHQSSKSSSTSSDCDSTTVDQWKRQELGPYPTRTNIIVPPQPTTSDEDDYPTAYKTTPEYPTTSSHKTSSTSHKTSPTEYPSSSSSSKHTTKTNYKRQTLGDPTRTNIETPSVSVTTATTTVVVTVTTTVAPTTSGHSNSTSSSTPSTSVKSSTSIKSTSNPWSWPWPVTRTTYSDDGETSTYSPDNKAPLTARDAGIISTITTWVTATKTSSSSTTKKTSSTTTLDWEDYTTTTTTIHKTTSTSKSSSKSTSKSTISVCDDYYEDCGPTTTSKSVYTISSGDFATTITLPPLTFGFRPKRDVELKTTSSSSSEDCDTTTTSSGHHPTSSSSSSKYTTKSFSKSHTTEKPSSSDSVIRATVTLPTLTLGTPGPDDWKRQAELEWKPSSSSSSIGDCDTTTSSSSKHTTKSSSKSLTTNKPSSSDSIIRATVTLPTLTLGTPGPDDWKREAEPEWKPSSSSSSTEDCDTTKPSSKSYTTKKPSSSDSVIRATVTLPTLTLGTPPAFPDDWKRAAEPKTFTPSGFKPSSTTTSDSSEPTVDPSTSTDDGWGDYTTSSSSTKETRSTNRQTSTTDGVIRATVTLPGITLGGPGDWKREEQKTKTSSSTKRFTTSKSSSKPRPTHKTSTDSVIRATLTLPPLTLGARDAAPTTAPESTFTPELSGFPGWSWYWPFPKPTTASDRATITLDLPPRQVLGVPTRTEIITPSYTGWWPQPTTSVVVVTITETHTQSSTSKTKHSSSTSTSTGEDAGTTTCLPSSSTYSSVDVIRSTVTLPGITLDKRSPQVLITATRTEIIPTLSVSTIAPPHPTWTGWPWWPPVVTITITSVIRETVTLPPITLGTPPPWRKGKRQGLVVPTFGTLTRTMTFDGSSGVPAVAKPTTTLVTSTVKPAL